MIPSHCILGYSAPLDRMTPQAHYILGYSDSPDSVADTQCNFFEIKNEYTITQYNSLLEQCLGLSLAPTLEVKLITDCRDCNLIMVTLENSSLH